MMEVTLGRYGRDYMVKVIEEQMSRRNALLQEYILEFLERTKCDITELTIVEETRGDKILLYIAKKSDTKGEER